MAKYKAFKKADVFNVIAESNNKAEMIKVAKKLDYPATVINTNTFDIAYENKEQKKGEQRTVKRLLNKKIPSRLLPRGDFFMPKIYA